jgi:uncharacterized protein (TIGR03067 family)
MNLLVGKGTAMSVPPMTVEGSRAELEKLQGIWRTVAVEVDGSSVASWLFENARLVIAGDRFTFRNPLPDADQRMEGVLKLDAGKLPKELKLTLDGGQTFEEIYELEENTLRVCYPIMGGRRPTDFKTTPQSDLSLVVYERESRP